jgi:outer membrane protein assembly factor BamC
VLPASAKIRVERNGTQRWLVVEGTSADKLWPQVKEFWQDNGFILNLERPEVGIMETDWAEDRAKIPQDGVRSMLGKVLDGLYSTSLRDKFRTRFESGAQADSVEVFISHRGIEEVFTTDAKERTAWQPRASDPELEVEMLRRLMVRLGAAEEKAAKTVAAAVPPPERASVTPQGQLLVQEAFDRTWRRVGLALDRVGFTVEDRDRTKGLFYVRYVDLETDAQKKDEPGLLSKLAFWKDTPGGKPKNPAGDQYRIRVKANGAGQAVVDVLNADNTPETGPVAQRILKLLQDQFK